MSQSLDDLDFLQDLIDTPDPPKGTRTRKPKDTRDESTWFKLDLINNRCLNCGAINSCEKGFSGTDPDSSFPSTCLECGSQNVQMTGMCSKGDECLGIVMQDKGPERVTAIVNGVEMCRWDFLDGLAKSND